MVDHIMVDHNGTLPGSVLQIGPSTAISNNRVMFIYYTAKNFH
jgi:hypothetical protein